MEGTRLKQDERSLSRGHGGRRRLWRRGARLLAVMGCLAVMAGNGAASDYFQACRSADGQYVMEAEALREMNPVSGESDGKSLTYKVLSRVALARREGYCVGMANTSQRYGHRAETYLLEVTFQSEEGQSRRIYLLCEEASDGLPASENCAKEVTTEDWKRRFTDGKGAARGK